MLSSGMLLSERYELKSLLGQGGMGAVWSAFDKRMRRRVAVKVLKVSSRTGDTEHLNTERKRLLREARAASAVHHPNVVQVLDVAEGSDVPFMVMELLSGISLRQYLDHVRSLDVTTACALLAQVASGVAAAHEKGVVHRDLKPENIFLEGADKGALPSGDSLSGLVVGAARGEKGLVPWVKVLDFGIAKVMHRTAGAQTDNLTVTGHILGSPPYMSPEQAFGENDIDHRTDIWSFGIVLYECLSGDLPTRAENTGQVFKKITKEDIEPIERLRPDVPPELARLLSRLLTRERPERLSDMREVVDVLSRGANGGLPLATGDAPTPDEKAPASPSPAKRELARKLPRGSEASPMEPPAKPPGLSHGSKELSPAARSWGSLMPIAASALAVFGVIGMGAVWDWGRGESSGTAPTGSIPSAVPSEVSTVEVDIAPTATGGETAAPAPRGSLDDPQAEPSTSTSGRVSFAPKPPPEPLPPSGGAVLEPPPPKEPKNEELKQPTSAPSGRSATVAKITTGDAPSVGKSGQVGEPAPEPRAPPPAKVPYSDKKSDEWGAQ